jgi:ABC-type transporter Mla maintaining outer membrane lipid asymmetry permease subunit MlaE
MKNIESTEKLEEEYRAYLNGTKLLIAGYILMMAGMVIGTLTVYSAFVLGLDKYPQLASIGAVIIFGSGLAFALWYQFFMKKGRQFRVYPDGPEHHKEM